jgi:hypothetical protein
MPARIVGVNSVLVAGESVNSAIESLSEIVTRFQEGASMSDLRYEMDAAVDEVLAATELVRSSAGEYQRLYSSGTDNARDSVA